ncbi:GGDEF domain-containing protein [Fulvimonas soli]|nr:GGDEF domain-containing protein [Fulvimonas soli]
MSTAVSARHTQPAEQPSPPHDAVSGAGLHALGGLAHKRVLDSVAQFTHHRDIDALDQSLTLSLAELAGARAVTLYKRAGEAGITPESLVRCTARAHGGHIIESLEPAAGVPLLESMRQCAAQMHGRIERTEGGGCHMLVPIHRDGQALGALLLEDLYAPDALRLLVDGFARIYANYIVLLHESERDKLTGLYNRRTFERQLQRLLQREGRLWLAILDIDHFKRINDTYGHLYGDEVILLLAQHMRASFGPEDVLFRFGGEEFVVLLAATDPTGAHEALERFRARVAGHDFPQIGRVTVSVGFVGVGAHDYPATVLDRADKALYFAKNHGRDRVAHYEALVAQGALGAAAPVGSVDLF